MASDGCHNNDGQWRKNVPKQLKAYVEDCGYTSVNDEITYEAKTMYHLPWPLVPSVSAITQLRADITLKRPVFETGCEES